MIRFLFFLRFRSQLRRTDNHLVDNLEGRILELLRNAGGIEKNERRFIGALFRESTPCLGLDIFTCVEAVLKRIEQDAGRLYGYALIIGKDTDELPAGRLCGPFSSPWNSGLYCDGEVQKLLGYYLLFESSGVSVPAEGRESGYARFRAFRDPEGFGSPAPAEAEQARRGAVVKDLARRGQKKILLAGPEFSGKRAALYELCAGGAPPLVIRFAAGGGLAALSDAYSPAIRAFFAGLPAAGAPAAGAAPANPVPANPAPVTPVPALSAELEALWESLSRDRLQAETLPFQLRRGRRFFALLLDSYLEVSAVRGLKPVLILEDIDRAPEGAARITRQVLEFRASGGPSSRGSASPGFEIYGTASSEELSPLWNRFFPRLVRLKGGEGGYSPDMSGDLWEVCYAFALLGRYFPGPLLTRLLAEGGKSSGTISRALEMLIRSGIVDTPQDPRPRIKDFFPRAEAILGDRRAPILAMVQDRLLDWVFSGRFHPCFALLDALAKLGGGAKVFETIKRGDEIILKSLVMDLSKGYSAGFEQAVDGGRLKFIVGPQRAATVEYLIRTSGALINGNERDIREAFRSGPAEDRLYPPFKARTLTNAAAFFLGIRDADSAQGAVKEAFVLSQNAPWSGLAQSNRLLSLVNLSKQRMGEAVDYAGFAVENAEKSGSYEELVTASFYDATVQFLYGNVSLAGRLAAAAEFQAVQAGRAEWIDRIRFFRGKLAFDLGRYQDALRIFEDITEKPAGRAAVEKLSLLEAWSYRARIYARNSLPPGPGGSIDAELFGIEGAYLRGDYPRAAELAAVLSESLPGEAFIYTEQPDWHSGFAQCELLLLPPREFWGRMVSVYQSLALCHLSSGDKAEALKIMQRVLRDERLSEMDPWDAFYYYAWYQVLEESGAAQVDMNTAISVAFKQLRRRASRIDDIKTRQAYLTLPRWNSALGLAAREHKLI